MKEKEEEEEEGRTEGINSRRGLCAKTLKTSVFMDIVTFETFCEYGEAGCAVLKGGCGVMGTKSDTDL